MEYCSITSGDLMELRVAVSALIRETSYHIETNKRLGIEGSNDFWNSRIVELAQLLERTSWEKIEIVYKEPPRKSP